MRGRGSRGQVPAHEHQEPRPSMSYQPTDQEWWNTHHRSWERELFSTTTTTAFLVFEGLGTLFESTDVHLNGPNIWLLFVKFWLVNFDSLLTLSANVLQISLNNSEINRFTLCPSCITFGLILQDLENDKRWKDFLFSNVIQRWHNLLLWVRFIAEKA